MQSVGAPKPVTFNIHFRKEPAHFVLPSDFVCDAAQEVTLLFRILVWEYAESLIIFLFSCVLPSDSLHRNKHGESVSPLQTCEVEFWQFQQNPRLNLRPSLRTFE
ncbi:hypothetical protein TNCV_2654781 [Trichonephila clavipes]|nr:hypothetical protein TNCV_2654781 [Trichonephila clavipes]